MMILVESRLLAQNTPDIDKTKDEQFSVLYLKELRSGQSNNLFLRKVWELMELKLKFFRQLEQVS